MTIPRMILEERHAIRMQILRQEKTLQDPFAERLASAPPGGEERACGRARDVGLGFGLGLSPREGKGGPGGAAPAVSRRTPATKLPPRPQPDVQAAFDFDF